MTGRCLARWTVWIAALSVMGARPADACSFPHPHAIFTRRGTHADARTFAAGELGIIDLNQDVAHLVVVYRTLAGLPLSPAERAAAVEVWSGAWDEASQTKLEDIPRHWTWDGRWDARRAEISVPLPEGRYGGDVDPYRTHRNAREYRGYVCINGDAFRVAIETLDALVADFGPNSREVAAWVTAQDQVFQNSVSPEPVVPSPAAADDHPTIRAHRAYQIAAAHFYSEQFDEAARLFDAIADDARSPWRGLGKFLAARCYIRKGTLAAGWRRFDATALSEAEARLFEVLADDSASDVHTSVYRLLPYVQQRIRPAEWARYHGRRLASLESASVTADDLAGYAWVRAHGAAGGADRDGADPLGEWLDLILPHATEDGAGATALALARWRATGHEHWLLAALRRTEPGGALAPEILEAVDGLGGDTTAHTAARFGAAKILARRGDRAGASERLTALLTDEVHALNRFQRNEIMEWSAAVAPTFDEFVTIGARRAAAIHMDYQDEPGPAAAMLAPDAAAVLDTWTPLRLLRHAVTSDLLPDPSRAHVAQAAWVRAVLLREDGHALALAPIVAEFTPTLAAPMAAYAAEPDDKRRHFIGLVTILRNPGLIPSIRAGLGPREPGVLDNLRDNWWGIRRPRSNLTGVLYQVFGRDGRPAFLTEEDIRTADAEAKAVIALGGGPDYLCTAVTKWVKRHRRDPLAAEALHLAVRSAHYPWSGRADAKRSKPAFDLLHKRYGDSKWAEKTPYWYD